MRTYAVSHAWLKESVVVQVSETDIKTFGERYAIFIEAWRKVEREQKHNRHIAYRLSGRQKQMHRNKFLSSMTIATVL